MSTSKPSKNILLVELIHLAIGIGFGVIPWGWRGCFVCIAFVLWKELYYDVRKNYGRHGYNWLWLLPEAFQADDGSTVWAEYRWGPGPRMAIGFVRKAWIDMVMYFAGMALGIWWQPW